MRHDFQHMMTKRFTETIEQLTGRKVLAFLSQAHVEPDITMEIFFIDAPLEGSARSRSSHPNSQASRPSRRMSPREGSPPPNTRREVTNGPEFREYGRRGELVGAAPLLWCRIGRPLHEVPSGPYVPAAVARSRTSDVDDVTASVD